MILSDPNTILHLDLFTGLGGFSLAADGLGFEPLAFCEIDEQCQRLLRRHYPTVEIINNVKEISKDRYDFSPTVITGGFPCQDLSVAGARAGLAGERSGLWFEYLRIIAEYSPFWVVVENVPGLLSSYSTSDPVDDLQEGDEREVVEESDFGVIIRGLVELGYGVSWRVFDAQYDGVAQRRQRIFIVASAGEVRGRPLRDPGSFRGLSAEVLFECEGGAWDPPPRRESREATTGTITSRAGHGGWNGRDAENGNLVAFGGNNTSGPIDVATSCNAHRSTGRFDFESETFIAHTLRAAGADASEDGTGRGAPLIVATLNSGGNNGGFRTEPGEHLVIAPDTAQRGRSIGPGSSRVGDSRGQDALIAFNWRASGKQSDLGADEHLVSCLHSSQASAFAFTERTRSDGRNFESQEELAYALTNPGSGGRTHSRQIADQFGVRRLTPRECERLQGYPDDYTRYDFLGQEISDSARYRMLGNSVAIPTVRWIMRRIAEIERRIR